MKGELWFIIAVLLGMVMLTSIVVIEPISAIVIVPIIIYSWWVGFKNSPCLNKTKEETK